MLSRHRSIVHIVECKLRNRGLYEDIRRVILCQ